MNKDIARETRLAMPPNLGHRLIDIHAGRLKALAASDAMVEAHFTCDVEAMMFHRKVVLAETMAAAEQAVMLGLDLGTAQRRSGGNDA